MLERGQIWPAEPRNSACGNSWKNWQLRSSWSSMQGGPVLPMPLPSSKIGTRPTSIRIGLGCSLLPSHLDRSHSIPPIPSGSWLGCSSAPPCVWIGATLPHPLCVWIMASSPEPPTLTCLDWGWAAYFLQLCWPHVQEWAHLALPI